MGIKILLFLLVLQIAVSIGIMIKLKLDSLERQIDSKTKDINDRIDLLTRVTLNIK